jgi:galactonate dehydratase
MGDGPIVKIVDVQTFLVPPRWCFLKVTTDEGIVGWGEPVVEGRAHTVAAAVHELSDYLIGENPCDIERHWQTLTKGGFYRGGPVLSSAVAGIDQALWDIVGKLRGVPVHELLGGAVRDRVRVYRWIGGDRPDDVADAALAAQRQGFSAVKMNASSELRHIDTAAAVEAIVARLASVREACGPNFDVAVDFHGRLSLPMARRVLPMLEPYLPFFVEEPVVPEMTGSLERVCSSTSIPIAAGERLYSRWDFVSAINAGIAVAQPDVSHAGGISEVRRIAALAETHDVALAPHCPLGPIALSACLQVDLVSANALIQEQSIGIHYNESFDVLDYLVDTSPLRITDGYIERLSRPGLGIEVDEAAVARAAAIGHRWRNPLFRRDDGSLAEW